MEESKDFIYKLHEGHLFRCVVPYEHQYITHCKERWREQNILSMFIKEFKAYSEDYYRESILTGKIQVNLKKVGLDYTLKNGDTINHKASRNEPPILAEHIKIVFESENLLVVKKPASMPVHPSGAYYKNSMIYILQHEMKLWPAYLVHRLDRVTSGIILLAKNSKSAAEATKLFQTDTMQKYYVARVKGNFPHLHYQLNAGITCLDHKNGVYAVDPLGKPSSTIFKKFFYDSESDQTVLECQPLTGRTHQIRVHLSHLNHPIANDIAYGGTLLNPVSVPEVNYKLQCGAHQIELENTKQVEIWLCSYRYVLTQNLDFSIPMPEWAQPGYKLI